MKALDDAIQTALTGISGISSSAPGGVHNTLRAQGSSFPVIVYQRVSSFDNHTYSGHGIEEINYDVKVIATIDKANTVGAIVESVHTALNRVLLSVTGYNHMQTLRVSRIPRYSEVNATGSYIHDGATYRFWVAKT